MAATNAWTTRFWDFIDNRCVVRRIVMGLMIWMTWDAYHWAAHFADTTQRTGSDVSLIIAAVLVPVMGLQGAVFKFYGDKRQSRGGGA